MLTRLTALILTLCIGLPMCWCCIVAPQQEEVASCCALKKNAVSHQTPDHSKEPSCPCARHEGSRDIASAFVQAPIPDLKLLVEPVWSASSTAIVRLVALAAHAPRHDHGPPLHTSPPLYARHCALLI